MSKDFGLFTDIVLHSIGSDIGAGRSWVVFYNTIPRKECTEDNVERIDTNGHNEPARNA